MGIPNALVLLTFVSQVLCYSGEFVPKSYYVIDHDGHKSDVVYFRSKRDVELFPLLRMKRGGGSSASSQSSAQASSSSNSGSGGGGGGAPFYPGGNGHNPGVVDPGFAGNFDPDFFHFGGGDSGVGGNGGGGYSHSFASSSSSSSSGNGQGFGGVGGPDGHNIPTLFSRFGEDTGTGVKVSGAAQGPRGAFSSSSSSIDGDGKIKYSVKSGKY
ncbi:hypothetical protein Zmor_005828 [Zophobas morio]|uniref:Uncharacterized protein n=1 Tax=Zophobas morio TaxID=2755281 RepID=A0AA38MMM4_9CUCU|nr:hypothetical protein Zmor_005828 [Zophobas morio]